MRITPPPQPRENPSLRTVHRRRYESCGMVAQLQRLQPAQHLRDAPTVGRMRVSVSETNHHAALLTPEGTHVRSGPSAWTGGGEAQEEPRADHADIVVTRGGQAPAVIRRQGAQVQAADSCHLRGAAG